MKLQAHAKINWALNITGRRDDGYHLLDMVMQSIALCDDLTLTRAEGLTLSVNGVPQADGRNLVLRAALALRERTGCRDGAALALTKRVPEQAGLGGGSADCAAALAGLNALWGLGLAPAELSEIGLGLGADVPFCLSGGLARVRGIGETIDRADAAPNLPLVLARPEGKGLSTGEVFGLWDRGGFPEVNLDGAALIDAVSLGDLAAIDRLCANALTAPAISLLPAIGETLDTLRGLGAAVAFMTGSGSTVVGVFEDPARATAAARRVPGAIVTHTLPL